MEHTKSLDLDQLDLMVDLLDDHLLAGDFSKVDEEFRTCEIKYLHATVLLAMLTISHVAKDKLSYYEEFYMNVEDELMDRGVDAKELLKGLE
jgi:hypothetical protein